MVRSLVLCFALGAAGCGVITSDTSANNAQNAATVVVSGPPPADKTEGDKPPKPDGPFIWVPGFWDNVQGNFIWKDGHWLQARPDREYVRARYEYDGKNWIYHRPGWKKRAGAT